MTYQIGPKGSVSIAAGVDHSARQFFVVLVDSAQLVQPVTVAGTGFGILENNPRAGETADVVLNAVAQKIRLGGTVSVGSWLTAASDGRAVAAVPGTAEASIVFGRALEAGVIGDIIAATVNFAAAFPGTDV